MPLSFILFFCASCGFLFPQHAQAACRNEQGTDDDLDVDWLFQEEEGEEDDGGSDGSGKVGVDVFYANLSTDGR